VAAFKAGDVDWVSESVERVIVAEWPCRDVLLAVKAVMVLMTFDRVLWGLPIAAVLVKYFFETGRLSTIWTTKSV